MQTLIFGPMPENARPESHLAAGAWCFAGREELFPGWDGSLEKEKAFPLPPDPFSDAQSIEAAAKAANGETLRLISLFGERFNSAWNKQLSGRFWQMAIGPALLLIVHMLAERQKRVLNIIELYGSTPLRVVLLPEDTPFSFASSLELMLHGVQDVHFNHYVYSRIVEAMAPPSWRLTYEPAVPLHLAGQSPQPLSLREKYKTALRKRLQRLPFPYLKGFRPWQVVALSLAVLCNKRLENNRRLDFTRYCDEPLPWRFPAEQLIAAALPLDVCNTEFPQGGGFEKTTNPGPLRGMSPAYSQDDTYRLYLAGLLERGFRLFSVQHGANYGNLQSVGGLPFEYSQHCFFTWGWEQHESAPSNARPLTHPALASIAGSHKEQRPNLILVGTEMSSFSYRLKSRTQSKAMLAYREAKCVFLRALAKGLAERDVNVLYRPYFATAGGLDDKAYVLLHLPQTNICTGDLAAQMLGCRLLALDHYGTTLLAAFAANVPTIAFWKDTDWGFDAQSAKAVDVLREAGILFESAQDAADKAALVWPDVQAWWSGSKVQSARQLWLTHYARIGDRDNLAWGAAKLTWRWFRALRNC